VRVKRLNEQVKRNAARFPPDFAFAPTKEGPRRRGTDRTRPSSPLGSRLHHGRARSPPLPYRVRSHRGTQFRQWATARLGEYLVKGFTMDDERLKNPPGKGQKDYFDELLERIRDVHSSERRFYQKVLDIYATSVDYTPDAEVTHQFFATVQNKMSSSVVTRVSFCDEMARSLCAASTSKRTPRASIASRAAP
jgi:hypothetical protein